jgi:hypothetical protein
MSQQHHSLLTSSLTENSIQINYLNADQPNMASVSVDGSQWVGPPQRSNAILQRASTVSAGKSSFNMTTERPGPDTNASFCCSGDMKRAHSIHVCIKTGACHHSHCTKEHLSKKMCQNLLRKLSAISKLRLSSQSSTDDSKSAPPPRKLRHWLRSNPKSRSRISEQSTASTSSVEDEHVHADPVGGACEAYGDYYFPHAALAHCQESTELPSGQFPSPQLVGKNSDLFSELPDTTVPAFELDSAIRPRSELPEASTIHRNQHKASAVDQYQRQLPKPQVSAGSVFSSFDRSSGSEGHWSWERSQWSSVSEITAATSTSEVDWMGSGLLRDSQVNRPSLPGRRLTLDTHLAVPDAPFTDGVVTDSPTAGDANDFAGLHPETHRGQEVVRADFARSDADVDFHHEGEVLVPPSWDHQMLLSPQHVQPPSPKLTGTPKDTADMFDIGSHLPPRYSAHPSPEDENLARVLEKYRQHARVMSVRYHKNLLTVIEDAFDLTVSHYLADVDVKRASRTIKLREAWSHTPTVDAAFYGMHELLTKEAIPTPYQLVSMAFLSLSLLGLSLGIPDLILATHNLHRHAKSWSNMIDCPKEKKLFEDLVDDLWLLAGQDQYLTQIDEVAHAYQFPQGAKQLQQAGPENFVVQVAQQFIQCQFAPPSIYVQVHIANL